MTSRQHQAGSQLPSLLGAPRAQRVSKKISLFLGHNPGSLWAAIGLPVIICGFAGARVLDQSYTPEPGGCCSISCGELLGPGDL